MMELFADWFMVIHLSKVKVAIPLCYCYQELFQKVLIQRFLKKESLASFKEEELVARFLI